MAISGGGKTDERSQRDRERILWQYSFGFSPRRSARTHGSTPPLPHRTACAFPKTLTGLLASVALAVLAALGVKTDGFHGKPSAPPTERPTAARTAPPPGDLPRTPSTFTAAKKALYDQPNPALRDFLNYLVL